ncbi:MAG: DNA repair protein RecO [Rhodovarius sp.]|nr:DNA repair protein RecO [Rhodovarius sp.]MCX7932808.1 DNA repair protein RecO [Rhodovarius sp.]MDW8316167.1 DNA repair protein RecO [Rhodovarius sp.]
MAVEWEGAAVVLAVRPHGPGGAVVTLLTEALGRHPAHVPGGDSRAQAAVWQPGNLVEARWQARRPEHLGSLRGELLHPVAALAMADPLALAVLAAGCAVAEGALPERLAHPQSFHGLVSVLLALAHDASRAVPALIRWELTLLAELGYGLDLSACAVSGRSEGLAFVSPRSGRAVSAAAAGAYAPRLLPLPRFLLLEEEAAAAGPAEWLAGLRLTGHFLARDAFGQQHRPLPEARLRLLERVAALAEAQGMRGGDAPGGGGASPEAGSAHMV